MSKQVIKGWVERLKQFFKWWNAEQEKLCPHCGYYCTGKSVFCLPPLNHDD